MNNITFCAFDKRYAEDFKRLNLEWIEQYFVVEEHDLEQLSNPQEYIIDKGGEILFALCNNEVAGVCALIKTGANEYELAKMGVYPKYQGMQVGYRLGLYAIETAKRLMATRLWLESNRILKPALHLYEKLGFKEIPVTDTPYARADIRMELLLNSSSAGNCRQAYGSCASV
ncbi:GNAT family N-acetyltransferase [Foetidibacter luteolus]|uniref:GNAT family N-acetyltransferase n=1 Tax=Foetidibacter luteolus TaxID=2608880 RepID=UPI00129B29E7|nr:GNAT family N-acetyltransferase [Foetidibacter luteolus]